MNSFYYDKIVHITLYDEARSEETKVSIRTTTSGLKPNISFEVRMLPNSLCYECTVKCVNLMYMNDIKKYKYMDIEAGYKYSRGGMNGLTTLFSIEIFSSWQESPNPDGVTVFRGVTVGKVHSLFSDSPITVTVNSPTTVLEFVQRTVLGVSGYKDRDAYIAASGGKETPVIEVHSFLPEELANMTIEEGTKITAGNGILLLTKLYEHLRSLFVADPVKKTYIQFFHNGTLNIGVLEGSEKLKITEKVITISSIYNASYNASILYIDAPWDPSILPGYVVKINPLYFNGQNVPLSLGDIKAPARLDGKEGSEMYRVLTSKVSFSSCGSDNKMSLMLIPITYLQKEEDDAKLNQPYQEYLDSVRKEKANILTEVVIGNEIKGKDTEKIFSQGLKGSFGGVSEVFMSVGQSFSHIANMYYGEESGHEDFSLTKEEYPGLMVYSIKNGELVWGKCTSRTKGIKMFRGHAWPLILMKTYTEFQKTKNNAYRVDINDPDTLPAGSTAVIPILPEDNEEAVSLIRANKELFKAMGDYYMKHLNNSSKHWAMESACAMYNMYLLGGGTL